MDQEIQFTVNPHGMHVLYAAVAIRCLPSLCMEILATLKGPEPYLTGVKY